MLTINVAMIQVIDLSIGFSHQEVYISFPQQSDNLASPDWSIFVRTLQQYSFNKDECSFEVADDCLKVRLVKDASSLWNGVYIGATENDLQVDFFKISLTYIKFFNKGKEIIYKDKLTNSNNAASSFKVYFNRRNIFIQTYPILTM